MPTSWQLSLEQDGSLWVAKAVPPFDPDKRFRKTYQAQVEAERLGNEEMAELLRALANEVMELTSYVSKGPLGTDDPDEAA